MKLPILVSALLLSSTPALAGTAYDGGSFDGKNYAMSFRRVPGTEDVYAVSIVEPRSVKGENGITFPSSLVVDCRKGEAKGYVAMGTDRSEEFMVDVLVYYLKEFCIRNGYEGYNVNQ